LPREGGVDVAVELASRIVGDVEELDLAALPLRAIVAAGTGSDWEQQGKSEREKPPREHVSLLR
jgi:hypothetical protein